MTVKLKPCPFCGNGAEIVEVELNEYDSRVKIVCKGCGVELNHTQEFYIHEKKDPITGEVIGTTRISMNDSAINLWNNRINEIKKDLGE